MNVVQECNCCGRRFVVRYFPDGSYDYVSEPCNCMDSFSPVAGPSIDQWLESMEGIGQ